MRKQDGVSVIVCCHNSGNRLKPTLEHLFRQSTESDLMWEIIVVDNNSTDSTPDIAKNLYERSGSKIPFQMVQESKPGLSHARNRGFESAKFNIALMVDDDNSICPTYVDSVHKRFTDSTIGMVGGKGIPVLEEKAPSWLEQYDYCYAVGPQAADDSAETNSLYGAGLALRLDILALLKEKGFESLLSDRVGDSLISGGDTELCMAFRMAGFKLIYDSTLLFEHHLPSTRMNWNYLRRLFFGFGITKARLDIYSAAMDGRPIPEDGKIPMWLNRALYLTKQLLPDLPILSSGLLFAKEGNDRLLKALAKCGHIIGIIRCRNEYASMYAKLYDLRNKLKNA